MAEHARFSDARGFFIDPGSTSKFSMDVGNLASPCSTPPLLPRASGRPFKTLKISAGYDPALTPDLETRKQQKKIYNIFLLGLYY